MADSTRSTSGISQGTAAATTGAVENHDNHAAAPDAIADSAGQVVTEAKKVGSELVGAVRDSAVSLLDAQRDRAATQIAAVGEALKRSAKSLDAKSTPAVVDYADRAAEHITGFAETMRNRSWNDLAGDVEDFARRWPMAFMASAVGLGFVAGRFLLSSTETTGQSSPNPKIAPAIPGRSAQNTRQPGTDQSASADEGKARSGSPNTGNATTSAAKSGHGAAPSESKS